MPRLSIVVVVHREQAYLRELAESVLGQAAGDVELLAIDDAAPGHAPALLDELAAADPRVRVEHLAERAGPGAARDAGLALATGDHVWFVHPTDRLPDGALAEVMARLEASPDVLLVGHTVSGPIGVSRPGPNGKLFVAIASDGPVTLEQRRGIAGAAPGAFDTILRREHLRELGVRFGPSAGGELPVIWPALLTARSIAATPAIAYERRPRENATPEGPATDVFAAYDTVFAWVAEQGDAVPAARRRLILPSLARHGLRLLRNLPEGERRAFFAELSAAVRRHRRGDEPAPGSRAARLRHTLVERNAYTAYRLLERALEERTKLRRRRARATRKARAVSLQRYYRSRLEQPIDPDLAVFAVYWFAGYSCNPRAIYEKARELVPGFRGVWVVKRDAVKSLPPDVEYVIAGTRAYYDAIARAAVLVNNVNFPNHLVKRPGSVHVMTHHGTPLKTMGMDLADTPVAGRKMDFPAFLRRCRRWDYSVSSNPLSTLVWERVFPTDHETLEVGYPRNDVLVNSTPDDVARIRAELGIEPGQTAVLYAPTHRDWLDGPILTFDLARIADALGPDHVLLARLHYFYGEDPVLRRLHEEGRVRDVAGHPSIEELCLAADVLLTDYSSLMFDYAVLDRPIVIHAPDWEVYRAVRGTYFDLMEQPPGVVTRTDDELLAALRSRTAWGEDAARKRAAFRAEHCALEDGHAAERVVRRLWPSARAAAPAELAAAAR